MEYYSKLASAIYNDVVSGLRGYTSNNTMSIEQLEDEIIETRLSVIKEFQAKGILPWKDLLMTIRCIPIDCKGIDYCPCGEDTGTPTLHFEIPQVITDLGGGIHYVGSVDMQNPFLWYTNPTVMTYNKYRKRAKNKPYVYVDTTPNENNMYDCWVFNTPILKSITIQAVFKDPRQLEEYGCCSDMDISNMSYLDTEVKRRLTELKIRYYRQLAMPIMPNNQQPR